MFATSETMLIVERAEILARMIFQTEIGVSYLQQKELLAINQEAQTLIHHFLVSKEKYEEAHRFGKFHPDLKQISKDMRKNKKEMDLHPTVAAFKKAETALENLLYEMSLIIGQTVSDSIKVPAPILFQQKHQQASCGHGGECNCQH